MFDSTARDVLLQKIAAIEKQAYAPPMPMPPDAATSMVPPPPPPQDPAMMAPPPMPPGAMPPPMDPSMGGVDPATGQPLAAAPPPPPPPMDPSQVPPMITMSAEDLTQAFEMIASKLGEAKPEGKSEGGGKLSEIESRLKNLETLLSQALGPVAQAPVEMSKQAFEDRLRSSAEARAAAEKPAQLELLQTLRRQRGV